MRARAAGLVILLILMGVLVGIGASRRAADAGSNIGRIVGTVTDEETGLPVLNVQVDAYDDNHGMLARISTGPDGTYQLTFGTGARVRLLFSHPGGATYTHLDEWYKDQPDFASADVVSIAPGATVTIDVGLARAGSISGSITADDTAERLNAICITARDGVGGVWHGRSGYLGGGQTGGLYEITGLAAGSYTLEFEDCLFDDYACLPPNLHFLSEWYDSALSMEAAQPVAVTLGEKTGGIDVALERDSTTPSPTPTPQLSWNTSVEPPSPRVGDEIRLQAGASGNGGLPSYTLNVSPADDGPVTIEEAPDSFGGGSLGASFLWRLRAVRPGTAVLRLGVYYETTGCYCPDREHCSRPMFFTSASSPDLMVVVAAAAGDANGDGAVDARDAALILQRTAGLVGSLSGSGDVNGDGVVDARDAALILQFVAGLLQHLPG